MSPGIAFEFPLAWTFGLPLFGLLVLAAWRQRRRGLAPARVASLLALRLGCILALLFLIARPVRAHRSAASGGLRPVIVMLDRSESMSLKDPDTTRYECALEFLNRRLMPALKSSNLPVRCMLFDQTAEEASDSQIASARPQGRRTNLGAAIAQALGNSAQAPLAVIGLTDGMANEDADNARAMSALLDSRVPFIGVGFGGDQGVQTLSLRRWSGPASAAPHTTFSLSAELELVKADQPTGCDLILFRDGQLLQKKSFKLDKGSCTWVESFQVTEREQGVHNYAVQLVPPNVPNLTCVNSQAGTSVRITDARELRVLYVQGALTWDYKFISLALRNDPSVKITGLTRTSEQSVFRQNVEGTGELVNGFPTSLEQLAPFGVVVLSNLRPQDLSPAQQELLARFCSEMGGGILMIGGAATFNRSWQNTLLEKMLPVVLSADLPRQGGTNLFRPQLTPEAMRCPIFQLSQETDIAKVWSRLPQFNQFAHVGHAKLGAQVWMTHPGEAGSDGRPILMASQRYGAGLSAVICLQNFWRWRLAKDTDTDQFDRFWRQLFRWLGEAGRDEIGIQVADQQLRPEQDVHLLVDRRLTAQNSGDASRQFLVQVHDGRNHALQEETLELQPGQQAEFRFRPAKAELYTVTVSDGSKAVVASHAVEVRDTNIELAQTARNMETLRQWASMSDGLAFKVEECPKAADLVAQIKAKVQQVQSAQETVQIVGLRWPTLTLVLGCLCAEWLLRKQWALI